MLLISLFASYQLCTSAQTRKILHLAAACWFAGSVDSCWGTTTCSNCLSGTWDSIRLLIGIITWLASTRRRIRQGGGINERKMRVLPIPLDPDQPCWTRESSGVDQVIHRQIVGEAGELPTLEGNGWEGPSEGVH